MKQRIEIPASVVVDGVPVLGGALVFHVNASSPQKAFERLARALARLAHVGAAKRTKKGASK